MYATDVRQTDVRQMSDAHHRLMPPRRGHNNALQTATGRVWHLVQVRFYDKRSALAHETSKAQAQKIQCTYSVL